MYKALLTFHYFIISSFFLTAQQVPAFNKDEGTVTLKDGTTLKGEIIFKPAYDDQITFKVAGDKKYKVYTYKEVQSFILDSSMFMAFKIKGNEVKLFGDKQLHFMKLVSSLNSKIKLFKHYSQERSLHDANGNSKWELEDIVYRVVFPDSPDEAIDIRSRQLLPGFDKKVGEKVKSCPSLYKKIDNKEDGYFYNSFAGVKRAAEIMTRIITEFDACK